MSCLESFVFWLVGYSTDLPCRYTSIFSCLDIELRQTDDRSGDNEALQNIYQVASVRARTLVEFEIWRSPSGSVKCP
jgi:hypothetical protein